MIALPRPIRPTGGSLRGWSYYSAWGSCPWKAWLKYHYREPSTPVDIQGTEARLTPRPLLIGSMFHEALEAYYQSGWKVDSAPITRRVQYMGADQVVTESVLHGHDSGTYDPEAAVFAASDMAGRRADEWPGELERQADLADVISLVAKYHQHYGPSGTHTDFPNFRLAADPYDPSRPALETELAIDLGDGLLFTSRFDAIFIDEQGALWGLEHKTSAASRVHALFQKAHLDGQVTGQWVNLCAHFVPQQARIGGVALNVTVKDAGRGKDPFQRRFFHRTDDLMGRFVTNVKRQAQRINAWLEEIDDCVVGQGVTPYQAALGILDSLPPSDQCYGFGKCDFYDICLDTGLGERILAGQDFVPRRSRVIEVLA